MNSSARGDPSGRAGQVDPRARPSPGAEVLQPEEYLRLLDQGIDLCTRWEEWSNRQFAALAKGDLTALVSVSARQARLVDAFFRLEFQWQGTRLLLEGSDTIVTAAKIEEKRRKLLSIAERVFAANYRNLRALNALGLLSATAESYVNGQRATLYDSRGHKGAAAGGPNAPLRTLVDREG